MRCLRLAGVALLLVAQGCALRGLSFLADERVKIVQPAENATVDLPFTVAWTVEDFDGPVVVVFDRSPMRPNQTLLSLVPENDPCRSVPGCPDAEWLAERNIYITDATRLEIETLPDRRDNNRSKDRHDLTIVLLDEAGKRAGESAFTREFVVERED